jgi:hypothetical protein
VRQGLLIEQVFWFDNTTINIDFQAILSKNILSLYC